MINRKKSKNAVLTRFLSDNGMLIVLFLLCGFFSLLTLKEQYPSGKSAGKSAADEFRKFDTRNKKIVVIVKASEEDLLFLREFLFVIDKSAVIDSVIGGPDIVRSKFREYESTGVSFDYIVTSHSYQSIVENIRYGFVEAQKSTIIIPPSYYWPTFLLPENIRNVANQAAVIAVIAIGMTMVIISGGIDLSVGSIIALSAVVTAWLIGFMGGEDASIFALILASLGGIVLSGGVGAFSGAMITRFNIPPFIATLAMMQVASGVGYIISQGKPIYRIPEGFIWLGRGAEPILGIPYAVLLMAVMYFIAHLLMSKTTIGRYIYAVGGGSEAARLAGIRVKRVLFMVYTMCGCLAGLGGVLMASQLKSGAPTYGLMYELYVIAGVVVGGTSLSGGEGKIFGTFIGVLIIGVIQNGMNLMNVESYTQKIVLGLVILGAVLIDKVKQIRFNKLT